jgi:hypothetical protein
MYIVPQEMFQDMWEWGQIYPTCDDCVDERKKAFELGWNLARHLKKVHGLRVVSRELKDGTGERWVYASTQRTWFE